MFKYIDSFFRIILEKIGLKLIRMDKYNERILNCEELAKRQEKYLKLLVAMNGKIENISELKSQFGQDLFVLYQKKFKRNGYFVEFGATDGISISNTYILEHDYGWTGILAEPAKIWHAQLRKNRSVNIDFRCVWSRSKENILFKETNVKELSTIDQYSSIDMHSDIRKKVIVMKLKRFH